MGRLSIVIRCLAVSVQQFADGGRSVSLLRRFTFILVVCWVLSIALLGAPADVALDIGRSVSVSFQTEIGTNYQIYGAAEADSDLWHEIGAPVEGDGSVFFFHQLVEERHSSFYRVEEIVVEPESLDPGAAPVDLHGIGIEMIEIPAGSFMIGSPDGEFGRDTDEGPQTEVTLVHAFKLGRTEVTQEQWVGVMGDNPSRYNGANRPVDSVSWFQAMEFCRRLTNLERTAGRLPLGHIYSLPTEAQWEYACRAGTMTRFSFGDDPGYKNLKRYAWYGLNSERPQSVAGRLPNPWGLFDMHGNVWEFCLDSWSSRYPGRSIAKWKVNPAGGGKDKVVRGGSWHFIGRLSRSANRAIVGAGKGGDDVGFQVALVPAGQ